MRPRPSNIVVVDGRRAHYRPGDHRHLGLVAAGTDAHGHPPAEIDSVDSLEETMHEVLAGLFTVSHDIDAGALLFAQRNQYRVALTFGQPVRWKVSGRPEHLRLCQPGRLGQAPGDCRLQHWSAEGTTAGWRPG
jgi:hypothetical protein